MKIEHKIVEKIKAGKRFLIVSHVNPDGDAIGSSLGLMLALQVAGKEAFAYNESGVPALYRFLPRANEIIQEIPPGPFDATFVLDCSTAERVGGAFVALAQKGMLVVVDHHPPREPLEGVCLIDTQASATAELVYGILQEARLSIPPEAATALYAAIMTDTGSFRFSNTTSRSLDVASRLMALGADHRRLVENIYESYPPERFRLLAMTLDTLEFFYGGRLATICTTKAMFREAGAEDDLTEGFVDLPRSIRGVEVAAFIREKEECEYRVNLRSRGGVDVGEVAARFGGGGHPNAAGCTLKGALEEVRAALLEALGEALE